MDQEEEVSAGNEIHKTIARESWYKVSKTSLVFFRSKMHSLRATISSESNQNHSKLGPPLSPPNAFCHIRKDTNLFRQCEPLGWRKTPFWPWASTRVFAST